MVWVEIVLRGGQENKTKKLRSRNKLKERQKSVRSDVPVSQR